jgi:FixJ family two-component response regulator
LKDPLRLSKRFRTGYYQAKKVQGDGMRFSTDLQTRAVRDSGNCVVVIDDDPEFRTSLSRLLRSVGLRSQLFASVADFLESEPDDCATCLVLDVRLPGQSGLDFQRELAAANVRLPIVFITGHGDIPMTVQAMKAGAIEFLTKPFRDQDLLDAVNVGLARDRERRENEAAVSVLRARFEVLTPRERAIVTQVAAGRLNKQIAGDMGVTETTVKVHRSNAMRKVNAASLAELCRMVDKLKLLPESSGPS